MLPVLTMTLYIINACCILPAWPESPFPASDPLIPLMSKMTSIGFDFCSEEGGDESFQNNDGFFTRKLPAELLKDINIVDTPGTNVIVDRQQRLTEEYVPRADLVLFCMSAGQCFTHIKGNPYHYGTLRPVLTLAALTAMACFAESDVLNCGTVSACFVSEKLD